MTKDGSIKNTHEGHFTVVLEGWEFGEMANMYSFSMFLKMQNWMDVGPQIDLFEP